MFYCIKAVKTLLSESGRAPFFGGRNLLRRAKEDLPVIVGLPLCVKRKPKLIQIEISNRCNLNCAMCIRNLISCDRGDMSLDRFKEMITTAFNYRHTALLYGQGEPFLHPDIIEMIKFERERGNFVTTVTNATLLDGNMCEQIIESGLNYLRVSIDGATEKTFNSIRRGADFSQVTENVQRLSDMVRRRDSELELGVACMATKWNLHELPQIIYLTHRLGIPIIEIKEVRNYLTSPKLSLSAAAEEYKVFAEELQLILEETRRRAKELGVKLVLQIPSVKKGTGCINPWFKTYVTFDGWVTPCSRYYSKNHYTFGNLFEEPFDLIWNNQRYQKFRQAVRRGNLTEEFKECELRKRYIQSVQPEDNSLDELQSHPQTAVNGLGGDR